MSQTLTLNPNSHALPAFGFGTTADFIGIFVLGSTLYAARFTGGTPVADNALASGFVSGAEAMIYIDPTGPWGVRTSTNDYPNQQAVSGLSLPAGPFHIVSGLGFLSAPSTTGSLVQQLLTTAGFAGPAGYSNVT